jgi:hypothetical protein
MKKYRCIKDYHFDDGWNFQPIRSFTKGNIYPAKDDDYDGCGILFVDDTGDDHFMHIDNRREYFVPVKNFKYGKKSE